jgi:hypothetical protein
VNQTRRRRPRHRHLANGREAQISRFATNILDKRRPRRLDFHRFATRRDRLASRRTKDAFAGADLPFDRRKQREKHCVAAITAKSGEGPYRLPCSPSGQPANQASRRLNTIIAASKMTTTTAAK